MSINQSKHAVSLEKKLGGVEELGRGQNTMTKNISFIVRPTGPYKFLWSVILRILHIHTTIAPFHIGVTVASSQQPCEVGIMNPN